MSICVCHPMSGEECKYCYARSAQRILVAEIVAFLRSEADGEGGLSEAGFTDEAAAFHTAAELIEREGWK